MNAKVLMIQGTSSGAGKSTLVIALCRIFSDMGYTVSPFKAQNMTSNFHTISNSTKKIARIQAVQAFASRKEPDTRMNPILLEPMGDYWSNVFVDGMYYARMRANEYYEHFVLKEGLSSVLKNLDELRQENDVILIEGAGSPAEINIADYDIANMILAEKICAPVILIADIERGGCFASIVGTLELLKPRHCQLVKGIVINKFRGDKFILDGAITSIERITKKEVLGIVPRIEFALPNEDSLDETKVQPLKESPESLDEQVNILASKVKESLDIKNIVSRLVGLEQKWM
ncbi:MAG: cobyric acid synthase [Thermoproteota archaeon]|nr:cobyric acid synthase [Thermoproteota archaeon]